MSSENREIRIGARQSDLSKIQSYEVGEALSKEFPEIKIDYYFKPAVGDLDQRTSLAAFEGKGVFTRDLTTLLLSKEVDLVVHSFKDLPTEQDPGTYIAGTLKRGDMRDLLLVRKDKVGKGRKIESFLVLSSSPRRSRNIALFLPKFLPFECGKIRFQDIRGNVPTRILKFLSGDAHALVVAKAAIDRILKSEREEFKESKERVLEVLNRAYPIVLPLRENPSAPAQGALALETRKDDPTLAGYIRKINSESDFNSVLKERDVLSSYGGGCHQKIGVSALSRSYGDILFVQGESLEGKDLKSESLKGASGTIPKANLDSIWPQTKDEGRSLFNREEIESEKPSNGTPLWISRDAALPTGWEPSWDTPLWCAGSETWAKLASRGVLVNGSAEGLGETEEPNIDLLFGKKLKWQKLSHSSGKRTDEMDFISSYKLVPTGTLPDLNGKTHFFWMSSSQFLFLLEKFPNIRDGFHSSGPGATATVISSIIGDTSRVFVYLSYDAWRKEALR